MQSNNIDRKTIEILAEIIGVDPFDIEESDLLRTDLHMSTEDVDQLSGKISTQLLNEKEIDLSSVRKVKDLIDLVHSEEEI